MIKHIESKRTNRKKLCHPSQIPTTLFTIRRELLNRGASAVDALVWCLAAEHGCNEYKNNLIVAAMNLERVSCLTYKGKDGHFRKPSEEYYMRVIFDSFAENPEEVEIRMSSCCTAKEASENVYKRIRQIAELVCPMMACLSEQAFVSEYAYAIDYVVKHEGNLPKPVMKDLFPTNYPDYRYWEGIANVIQEYALF